MNANTLVLALFFALVAVITAFFYTIIDYMLVFVPDYWGYLTGYEYISYKESMILGVSAYIAVKTSHLISDQLFFLFQNEHTERVVAEMDRILTHVSPDMPSKISKKIKKKAFLNRDRIKAQLEEGKLTPRQITCLLFVDELVSTLPKGNYHIYRGILDIPGSEMYRLWRYALNYLLETDYFDEPNYNYIDNSMSLLISKAG